MTTTQDTLPSAQAIHEQRWDGTLEAVLDDEHLEAVLCETIAALTPAGVSGGGGRLALVQLVSALAAVLS